MRSRLFRENHAKECQEIEEFVAKKQIELDKTRLDELSVHQKRDFYYCESTLDSNSGTEQSTLSDASYYDPETASSSGASQRSQSTLDHSES